MRAHKYTTVSRCIAYDGLRAPDHAHEVPWSEHVRMRDGPGCRPAHTCTGSCFTRDLVSWLPQYCAAVRPGCSYRYINMRTVTAAAASYDRVFCAVGRAEVRVPLDCAGSGLFIIGCGAVGSAAVVRARGRQFMRFVGDDFVMRCRNRGRACPCLTMLSGTGAQGPVGDACVLLCMPAS